MTVNNDTKINDLKLLSEEKPLLNELRVLIKDITVLKSINCVPLILFIMNSFLKEISHKRIRISNITPADRIKAVSYTHLTLPTSDLV